MGWPVRSLIDPEHSEIGGTGLTGVRQGWRRMGIATALKLFVLRTARERGVRRVVTDNEENNPMLGINQGLGFKPLPAWLGWSLTLDSQELTVPGCEDPRRARIADRLGNRGSGIVSLVCILSFPK